MVLQLAPKLRAVQVVLVHPRKLVLQLTLPYLMLNRASSVRLAEGPTECLSTRQQAMWLHCLFLPRRPLGSLDSGSIKAV